MSKKPYGDLYTPLDKAQESITFLIQQVAKLEKRIEALEKEKGDNGQR